jgi:prepilin-type N-terminal cleavage/methylation domain-containing protein
MVLEKMKRQKLKGKSCGFTLVEMLVAVAIFSIVTSVAIGFFTTAIKSQRKVLAQQQLLDQASYAMEYMSRAIRMAKKDDVSIGGVTKDCLPENKVNYTISQGGVKFRTYDNSCQQFYLSAGQLIENKDDVILPLTSPSLVVKSFTIIPSGWDQSDSFQPAVTIFLDIEYPDLAEIKIQTTISQRNLDVQY